MQKWEYIVSVIDLPHKTEDLFNVYGTKGWELVSVDNGIAYFKRPTRAKPYAPTFNFNLSNKTKDESS